MKITVICFTAKSGGSKSIIEDFYSYLIESKDTNEWTFLLSKPIINETRNIKTIIDEKPCKNWIKRILFDFFFGGNYIDKYKPDIVLNFQNTFVNFVKCKQFLYIHQALPFQNLIKYSFFKKEERIFATYQYLIGILIKKSIKKSNGVFVQTEWMKKEIQKYANGSFVEVVKPRILRSINQTCTQKSINYMNFFYPASYMPYKNHSLIIDALKQCEALKNIKVFLTINNIKSIDKRVICMGEISRERVMEMYKSSILIFPSYIETYGMPLKEAMLAGTIILASDTKFSHEILDGYENAYFFNPFDKKELANLIKDVANKRIKLININRKELYEVKTWETIIEKIEKEYFF